MKYGKTSNLFNIGFLGLSLGLMGVVGASKANAGWTELTDLESPITVSGEPITPEDVITFSPSPADAIWFSDQSNVDVGSQDIDSIATVLLTDIFPTATSIVGVDQWDSLAGDGTSYTGNAFNIIAVHYDNKELIFGYIDPIDAFTVNDLGQEISNIRTYSAEGGPFTTSCTGETCTNDIPEPSTFALLGLGMVGLVVSRRKNKH